MKKNALKMFANDIDSKNVADVESVLKMYLVVKFMSVRVFFCQACKIYQYIKKGTEWVSLAPTVLVMVLSIIV